MNRTGLQALLDAERVRANSYSIDGGVQDESMVLEEGTTGWIVYYAERGLRSGERLFATEEDACDFLARRLLTDPSNRIKP